MHHNAYPCIVKTGKKSCFYKKSFLHDLFLSIFFVCRNMVALPRIGKLVTAIWGINACDDGSVGYW